MSTKSKKNDAQEKNLTTKVVDCLWDDKNALVNALEMCASEAGLELSYLASMLFFLVMDSVPTIHSFLEQIANWYKEQTGIDTKVSDMGDSSRTYVVNGRNYRFAALYRSSQLAKPLVTAGIGKAFATILQEWNAGDPQRWFADTFATILGRCITAKAKSDNYVDPASIGDPIVMRDRINDWLKRLTDAVRVIEESPNMPVAQCLSDFTMDRLVHMFATNTVPNVERASKTDSLTFEGKIVSVLKEWDKDVATTLAAIAKLVETLYEAKRSKDAAMIVDHLFDETTIKLAEIDEQKTGRVKTLAATAKKAA